MPEQHAHVLYTKLLLSRGHGYPLWTPEPDYSLCSAYVGRGICVGDVGIIRDDGGFDFIFNAFLEADDPVHEGGVPPNFSPLHTESPNPIRTIYFQHPRDSSVRSSHVSVKSLIVEASAEVPSIAGGGAGFEFSTSKDQAAVLILPQGGTRFDRKNLSSMRKYALEHAHEWYEYINSPNYLGREALNGSLCFVTGCDKTTAWGSAAMSKPSDTRQFSIKFLVGGLSEGRIALRSSRSTQEWTDTRIYPDQDTDMSDAPLPVRENQGVFIRSFTISVREKSRITKILPGFRGVQLAEVSGKSGNPPVIGSKAPYSNQRHDSPPVSAPAWTGNGDMIRGSIVGNELMQLQISIINAHMKSFGESHQRESISDYPSMSSIPYGGMNIPDASQLSSDEQDHVVLQYFPERSTELLNPSVKFNEYILSTVPESDVVVTHDSAWMLPMLLADVFISGLSAPRFLMAGKPPSYVRSKRGRMKRTRYFKVRVRTSTPDLKEIKMSTSFRSFGYARIFSCLYMPLSPLQVDAELPDYIQDRFPRVNTSQLVLEFAKGASYIFHEIPFSKESLQIQGTRSSQVPQRPQFIHQSNLVMRYDGLGLVGCITEAGPVLRSSALSTNAYNTSESIVTEINLLASPLTLYPVSMAPAPEDHKSSSLSGSSRGTPTYNTVDLPRTPSASKGACWTCRLRRKKCDEQWEGDSCRTCVRLTIDCLGWSPKRPEWMRDKEAVEAYKANIKAKLTRAGLIRGQPRTSMLQAYTAEPAPTSRLPTFHHLPTPSPKTPEKSPSTTSSSLALDVDLRPVDYHFDPPRMGGMPSLPNIGPSSGFHQLPATSYSDSNVNLMDFGTPTYQYSPQSSSVHSEPLDIDMGLYIAQHSNDQFDFNIRPPSPIQSLPLLAGQNSIQESHVMYFFEHVRKTNLPFSSNALTNLTYTMTVQEPRGAVTNAVCALSSLHFTRMRVAQGLEAPDPNLEHSTAQYFDEAALQLASGKQAKSRYAESDVLAALYLLCFSQMAGCTIDWRPMLAIAMEWITQTGLPTAENPMLLLANMSTSSQLIVKYTMWMDIFASFTLMKQPKYLALYKCLLGDQNGFWGRGLHMENLTGCPDEAMLALAEISGLAHWKTSEQAKGSLNFRELVRRGDDIEQRLRNWQREPSNFGEQTPLHPNLMQTSISDAGAVSYSDEVMQLVGNVFRESALLYLRTIINEDNPAVPEIDASVNTVIQLLHELEPSEIDRTLVFPVCLAGCMTSNSSHRDLLKSRLQSQDESIGNLLQTRLVMEVVWQKPGESGSNACEWREILRERCPNLLLI